MMAMAVNPVPLGLQPPPIAEYMCNCYITENSGYRAGVGGAGGGRSPGKSEDYCNGNLMCLVNFPDKEKQTES